jgi:hypothetical protein
MRRVLLIAGLIYLSLGILESNVTAQVVTCRDQLRALGLATLPGPIETHYSEGYRDRAVAMQALLRDAAKFYERSLKLTPAVTLAALGPDDWPKLLDKPYGLPTLRTGLCRRGAYTGPPQYVAIMPVTAGGPIYTDWLAMKTSLSPEAMRRLKKAGLSFEEGGQTMLDFVALHELGHAYAHALGIETVSSFFAEFTGNYLAYAFLKSTPGRLDKKAMAVLRTNVEGITPIHASIDKFESFQSREHPPTEAWYNSVFTLKAQEVYDRRGLDFILKVRDAFTGEKYGTIKTDEILRRLERIEPGFVTWSNSLQRGVRTAAQEPPSKK